jgi:hypothetical protein
MATMPKTGSKSKAKAKGTTTTTAPATTVVAALPALPAGGEAQQAHTGVSPEAAAAKAAADAAVAAKAARKHVLLARFALRELARSPDLAVLPALPLARVALDAEIGAGFSDHQQSAAGFTLAMRGMGDGAQDACLDAADAAGADTQSEAVVTLAEDAAAVGTFVADEASEAFRKSLVGSYTDKKIRDVAARIVAAEEAREEAGFGRNVYVGRGECETVEGLLLGFELDLPDVGRGAPIDVGSSQAEALLAMGIPFAIPAYRARGRIVPESFVEEIRFLLAHPDGARVSVRFDVFKAPASDADLVGSDLAQGVLAADEVRRRVALANAMSALLGAAVGGDGDAALPADKRAAGCRLAQAAGLSAPAKGLDRWLRNLANVSDLVKTTKKSSDDEVRAAELLRRLLREGVIGGDQSVAFMSPKKVPVADRLLAYERLLALAESARTDGQPRLGGFMRGITGRISNPSTWALRLMLYGDAKGLLARCGGDEDRCGIASASAQAAGLWNIWKNPSAKAGAKSRDAAASEGDTGDGLVDAPAPAPTGDAAQDGGVAHLFAALDAAGLLGTPAADAALLAARFMAGQVSVEAVIGGIRHHAAPAPAEGSHTARSAGMVAPLQLPA